MFKYCLFMLLLGALHTLAFSSEFSSTQLNFIEYAELGDSLSLKKEGSNRVFTIAAGQSIKIWAGDLVEKGIFKELNDDTLVLETEGGEIDILVNDIGKIRILEGNPKKSIGTILRVTSVVPVVYGGVWFVVGLIDLINDEDYAPVTLIGGPLVFFVGFGLYKLGSRISGRSFKLNKKWSIIL